MVVLYVDNVSIAYANENNLKKLFSNLESKGLNFTCEGTFTVFLGINFTLKVLIQKIKDATGMSDSNYNWTPALLKPLSESIPTDLPWKNLGATAPLLVCCFTSPQTLAPTLHLPSAKLPGSVKAQREVMPPPSRLLFAICTAPAKWA
jgi:hypothetical protein